MNSLPNVLFCSLSVSPQAWYRCGLPANALELDWLGYENYQPPNVGQSVGGNIDVHKMGKKLQDYDIVVGQMVRGDDWEKFIKEWQATGKKFVYEVDDFVHGVRRTKGHRNASAFNKDIVKKHQKCMEMADAMICSTDYLSEQYTKYNENQFVCKNSLDTWRYQVERPKHKNKIVVGWAGGTGHDSSIVEALRGLVNFMKVEPNAEFWTFGYEYYGAIAKLFPDRTKLVPWTLLENYPYAIASFDIALAPGHESKYIMSKSDLRWLESSAVGVPVIGDDRIYHEIEDGKTGLYARTGEEYYDHLLYFSNPDYGESRRNMIGSAAQDYVRANRDIAVGSEQWRQAFLSLS